MPPQEVVVQRQKIRQAFLKARKITGMLQATMGLEGQALDERTLKAMTKQTVRELLLAR
jgi:hypothetical protein